MKLITAIIKPFTLEDVKTGFWAVRGVLVGTGGETPPELAGEDACATPEED